MSLLDKAKLVVTPTAWGQTTLYSVKPNTTDGDFDFTRNSGINRVNSSGLIEPLPYNLLKGSNNFSNDFTISNASIASGQADRSGGTDAWLFTKNATTAYLRQSTSSGIAAVGPQTVSIYAKAGTLDFLFIKPNSSSADGAYFDLSSGTVGTVGANVVRTAITADGNGYYRCEVELNKRISQIRLSLADVDGGDSNGNTGNIYIQDCQLVKGSSARTYYETTNRRAYPVISYANNAGHLQFTGSRTNFFRYSDSLITNWSATGTNPPTFTEKQFTSPDGRVNASRLEFPSTATASAYSQTFQHLNNYRFAITCYVKSNTGSNQTFRLFGDDASVSAISSVFTATSEWQRFEFLFTATSTATKAAGIYHDAGSASDLQVFGAQLERGSTSTNFSASPYIPAANNYVSRSADNCYGAGIGASGIFNDSEGVLYAEVATDHENSFRVIAISDGSTNNCVRIQFTTTENQVLANIRAATATSMNAAHTLTDASAYNKIAISYKENDFKFYVNGTQVGTDTSGTTPTGLNQVSFGNFNNSNPFIGRCKMLAVFDEQLTTDELECLTTP